MARWQDYEEKQEKVSENDELLINSGGIVKRVKAKKFKGEKGDKGLTGDKGEPFRFNDFTPEQLQSIKGDKGDAFEYSDFTEEQLEALRGPQGVQGIQGEQGIQGVQGEQGIQGPPGRDGTGTGDMLKSENLSGLSNVEEARENLQVYSKNEVIKKPIEVTINNEANIQGKSGTTTAGNYNPQYGDELILVFNKGSTSSNVTLNIDGSGAKNLKLGYSNVTWTTLNLPVNQRGIVRAWYDGAHYQIYGATANHTYQTISEAEALNPNNNLARLISGQILGLLRDRTNHTGGQDISTITNLGTELNNINNRFATHIPPNSDLDNYKTPGFYYQGLTANARTMVNIPLGQQSEAFGMIVYEASGVIQELTFYNLNYKFIRRFYGNNWSTWKEIPMFAKHGHLNIIGSVPVGSSNTGFALHGNRLKAFRNNHEIFWADAEWCEFTAYPTVNKPQSHYGHSLVRKDYVDGLLDNKKIKVLTEQQYNSIQKDNNTLYFIRE